MPRLRSARRLRLGIRGRMALGTMGVVGLALLLGAIVVVQAQRQALTRDIETAAALRANDIASALIEGTLPEDLLARQPDEALVQVLDPAGHIVASTTNTAATAKFTDLAAPAQGHAAVTLQHIVGADDPFRVVAVRADVGGESYTVYVGKSVEPVEASAHNLALVLALGIPPLLVFVGAVTWIVTGRTLRPVESMRAEVETISARDLHRRITEPTANDEVGRLARTMNTMLGRLQRATEREQQFIADASHELRSPLASMRAQLEVDLAHPEGVDLRSSHTDSLAEVGHMQRLVDDLLLLARADHRGLVGTPRSVDLDDIVLDECRRAGTTTSAHIDASGVSGAQVEGDPHLLTRAVRNLIENAARYAVHDVVVTLREADGLVTITISDDGPGVPVEARAQLFERFTRADDSRSRTDGGTGLGLAITREIVNAHNGAIRLDEGSPGARFVVDLPVVRIEGPEEAPA